MSRIKRRILALNRYYAVRSNVKVGNRVHIGVGSILWAPSQLVVEDDVYIGKGCTIECNGTIGRGALIANRVGIVGRVDHDARAAGVPIRKANWVGRTPALEQEVGIGPDAWIGYGAIVLSRTVIGRGAVVAAGSVVTNDVEPYAVVAGNPANQIGWRFDDPGKAVHDAMLKREGYVL